MALRIKMEVELVENVIAEQCIYEVTVRANGKLHGMLSATGDGMTMGEAFDAAFRRLAIGNAFQEYGSNPEIKSE